MARVKTYLLYKLIFRLIITLTTSNRREIWLINLTKSKQNK